MEQANKDERGNKKVELLNILSAYYGRRTREKPTLAHVLTKEEMDHFHATENQLSDLRG